MAVFNHDFTTHFGKLWKSVLGQYIGVPNVRGMEIGCWEGRSSRWFVENILTGENSKLICIDPWPRMNFVDNLQGIHDQICYFRGRSGRVLRNDWFEPETLDFAYIDGDHRAPGVLEDAVLTFYLLKHNGIIIFDDYLWSRTGSPNPSPQDCPKLAIDSFLAVYAQSITEIYRGYQVIVKKL